MNAAEKANLAQFIDLAAAVAGTGYRGGEQVYDFSDSLEQIAADVRACSACRLCETRKNAVPGEGPLKPLVMVIGEGPGADEDATGRPFVGRAGQLLDKMLASIGLFRESNCFIGNVIKCRPPGNRDPQPDERAACAGFLERQIQLLQPRFILCAGRISAQALLDSPEPIGRLRGKRFDYQSGGNSIPLFAMYHPSALLRSEDLKRPAWEDLKLLRSALEAQG
jgi:DNA polymerase